MRVRFFNKMNIFVYMGMVSSKKKFAALTYTAFQWWIKKKRAATIFGCISLLHTQKFLHTETDRQTQTNTHKIRFGISNPFALHSIWISKPNYLKWKSYTIIPSCVVIHLLPVFLYLSISSAAATAAGGSTNMLLLFFFLFFQFTKISVAFIWNSEFNIN